MTTTGERMRARRSTGSLLHPCALGRHGPTSSPVLPGCGIASSLSLTTSARGYASGLSLIIIRP